MGLITEINRHIITRINESPDLVTGKEELQIQLPQNLYKERLLQESASVIEYDAGLTLDNDRSWLYRKIHSFGGRSLLPKSKNISSSRQIVADLAVQEDHEWNYTPITLRVGDKKMHAMAVTHKDTVLSKENPGDWVLGIFGRGNSLESRLSNLTKNKEKKALEDCGDVKFRQTVRELSPVGGTPKSALLFNYADDEISKDLVLKTTRTALRLLTEEDGINANSVDIYQYSFGVSLGYHALAEEEKLRNPPEKSPAPLGVVERVIAYVASFFPLKTIAKVYRCVSEWFSSLFSQKTDDVSESPGIIARITRCFANCFKCLFSSKIEESEKQEEGFSIVEGEEKQVAPAHTDLSKVKRIVSDRSFNKLSVAAGWFFGIFVKALGWEMHTEGVVDAIPENIEQKFLACTDDKGEIVHDKVIPAKASLAQDRDFTRLDGVKHSGYLEEGVIRELFSSTQVQVPV